MHSLTVNRSFLELHPLQADGLWRGGATALFRAEQALTRTRIHVEGAERIPLRPVLLATNSSQKYDFLAIRSALEAEGIQAATLVKAKYYHSPWTRFLLPRFGGIPLASKGYLITLDFRRVHRRLPREDEYRQLRDHLEGQGDLPAGPSFDRLQTQPREVAGTRLEPGRLEYREALLAAYRALMNETIRLCRSAMAAGHHVHVYPEGTVSSRLAEGRSGVVQLARALRVPVVPIGVSGCREAFRGRTPLLRGGSITLRVGEPLALDATELPPDFRPFAPDDERRHRRALKRQTDLLMERLNALLEPGAQRLPGRAGDGVQGVRRFL